MKTMFIVTGPEHAYIWRAQEMGAIGSTVGDGYSHLISFPPQDFAGLSHLRDWEVVTVRIEQYNITSQAIRLH